MPKPTNVTATGIIRGIAVDVPPPPVNINRWAETEVHISSTSGFTPDASTLKDAGKKTHFEITSGLVAGTTYYLRAFYVDLKGNKSQASDEVSAVAGRVGRTDIAEGGRIPFHWAVGATNNLELVFNGGTAGSVEYKDITLDLTSKIGTIHVPAGRQLLAIVSFFLVDVTNIINTEIGSVFVRHFSGNFGGRNATRRDYWYHVLPGNATYDAWEIIADMSVGYLADTPAWTGRLRMTYQLFEVDA